MILVIVIFLIFLTTQLGRFTGGLGVEDKTEQTSETEEEARELSESEGVRMVNTSTMALYGVESVEDIDNY